MAINGFDEEEEEVEGDWGRPKSEAAERGLVKVRRPVIVPKVARRMVLDLAMLGAVRWVAIFFLLLIFFFF